ncbi:phage virion morphogenesis protein [Chitiniphilus eburneus]|uniref:phage virion morphogenesis protein n=1 Tax=Chitiniphilus eburneus TaxID=2571148 RepID=UPI0035D0FAC5
MIDLSIDHASVTDSLGRVAQATAHRADLMRLLANIMGDAVEENFAQEGRPRWLGLKPPGRPGGRILQSTGRLASSVIARSDADHATVGTNVKYAAIHQFGGQTRAHVIRPRNKRALAWAGAAHPVTRVNHPGSKIPARPFLLLTDYELGEIEYTVEDYLRRAAG